MYKASQLSPASLGVSAFAIMLLVGAVAEAQRQKSTNFEGSSNVAQDLSNSFREAAERASHGVVTVYTLRGARMTAPWRLREEARQKGEVHGPNSDIEDSPVNVSPDEQGSGIVIDKKGFILTCSHVVASADAVYVRFPNGRRVEPVEVWMDPESDLAILRVEADFELPEVRLGNSDDLAVGDWVVSLASPYDMTQSVSAGIVSTTDRWVTGMPNALLQNDAATNPGSSGGALLNLHGEVVGIIIGGFGTREEFQGIGFAIPIKTAKGIADELRINGHVRRGYLGCQTEILAPEIAQQLELPVNGGIYVKDVVPKSPAALAGIQQGDIFTGFDGHPIDDTFRHEKLYLQPTPGEKHAITLVRHGKTISVEVEIGHRPVRNVNSRLKPKSTVSAAHFDKSLGLGVDNLAPNVAEELGLPSGIRGVLVSHVSDGGPAYIKGVAAGMAILRINDRAIQNLDDYKEAASQRYSKKPILMLLQSNREKYLVIFGG